MEEEEEGNVKEKGPFRLARALSDAGNVNVDGEDNGGGDSGGGDDAGMKRRRR